MIKPLYIKGHTTSVENSVNQSVNNFSHSLCQFFGKGYISDVIVL